MTPTLPAHAHLIASPDVWMESSALEQLARVALLPGCLKVVGMPDLHPGRGIPVGAAFSFAGRVLPELVGSDAGCGVLAVVGRRDGPRGDALMRRVLGALAEPALPDVPEAAQLEAVWHEGPRGLRKLPHVPDLLCELAARYEDDDAPSGTLPPGLPPAHYARQLGSVGGGNHFAEIARVDSVVDRVRARAHGLSADAQVVLVHTGSRALGAELLRSYEGQVLEGDDIERYLRDLRGAVRYARANRLLTAYRLLGAAGLGSSARIAACFDIVHNGVEPAAGGTFLHRKGAAPAARGEPTLVLGSRGAASWIMEGLGSAACLGCVAHGAGRRMARGDALAKLRMRHTRASLVRSPIGSYVLCDDTKLMYEEHPDAYKPLAPVLDSLEQAEAAVRVASLVPLVTVKR